MSLPDAIDNLKDIGLYSYSVERNGDIELNFKVRELGSYKLTITEKEIKRMVDASEMMIKADKLGYFDK